MSPPPDPSPRPFLRKLPLLARLGVWVLALAAVAAVAAQLFFTAWPAIEPFHGWATNGAFQLLNPLRRMAAGQTPGVDFPFFHGLGVPLVHYPAFALLGGDLRASELARHLTSGALYLLCAVLLLRAWRLPWAWAVLLGAGFTSIASEVGTGDLVGPGNSLLGVRTTAPLLVAAVAFGLRPRAEEPRATVRFAAALAGTLGLSLFLGTEQGLASFGGLAVAGVLTPLGARRFSRRLAFTGAVLVGGFGAYVLLLTLATRGQPLAPLRYALLDVPADQFWYFGVPPNAFIHRWAHFTEDARLAVRWAVALLLLAPLGGVLAWRLPREERGELGGYAFLLVYGLASTVSYLGMMTPFYLQPLLRVEWLLGLYLVLRGVPLFLSKGARPRPAWVAPASLVLALAMAGVGWRYYWREHGSRPPRPGTGLVASGLRLGPNWGFGLNVYTTVLGPPGQGAAPDLWPTYAGVYEAAYGVLPAAEDYIIQPLGPGARERYRERFRQVRPRYVSTIRRGYSVYEEWLQHETWPWYEELARNYFVRAVTVHSLLWERRPDATWEEASGWEGTLVPEPDAYEVALPASAQEDVLVVEVEYRTRNRWSWVPLLGKLPRYLLALPGTVERQPVSLPPYQRTWTFAVHRRPGVVPRLRPEVPALLAGAGLTVERVRWRVLPLPELSRLGLLDGLRTGLVVQPRVRPGTAAPQP